MKKLNHLFRKLKRTYIVSDYAGSHEWIYTRDALCKLHLRLILRGRNSFGFPRLLARKINTKWAYALMMRYESHIYIERLDPSKDQITHHSPWDGCM